VERTIAKRDVIPRVAIWLEAVLSEDPFCDRHGPFRPWGAQALLSPDLQSQLHSPLVGDATRRVPPGLLFAATLHGIDQHLPREVVSALGDGELNLGIGEFVEL
jgi:hypothetical protein